MVFPRVLTTLLLLALILRPETSVIAGADTARSEGPSVQVTVVSGVRTAAAEESGRSDSQGLDAGAEKTAPAKPETKAGGLDKGNDEVLKMKRRIIEIQNSGKLGFRKVVVCNSVDRFGVYSPATQGNPLSKIILYIEPSNYGTLVSKDRYIIDCTVDVAVLTGDGKLLGGKEGLFRINRVSRSPVLDLYFKVQVNLKRPLVQDMIIKTRLRDGIKNDAATSTLKINLKSRNKGAKDNV